MLKPPFIPEICEFLGVIVLAFIVLSVGLLGELSVAGNSILAGAIVMMVIYGVGTISGAHINPVVSFGFWWGGQFAGVKLGRYLVVQCLGSIVAMILISLATRGVITWSEVSPPQPTPIALLIEGMVMALLMFVIFSVATTDCRLCPDARPLAGVIVGVTIAVLVLFGGTFGAGILNPAVLMVPTILSGQWLSLVLFTIVQAIGAIAGVNLFRLTHPPNDPES